MAGSVTNTGARKYKADFDSLYPCSFTFAVELNEYTDNHEQKIDVVCKSQPVRGAEETTAINILCESSSTLGEEATHAIESMFAYVVEDTEQTSDNTKVSTRWRTSAVVDTNGAPFVIEKMYCRNSDTYERSYKEYELVFKYTFSKGANSICDAYKSSIFCAGEELGKGYSIAMYDIVTGVIQDNLGRFELSKWMLSLIKSETLGKLRVYTNFYDILHRPDRKTIFYYSKEIGDFKIYVDKYNYGTKEMEFSTEPVPEGEKIKRLIRSKFPWQGETVDSASSQYTSIKYYPGKHIESPFIIMQGHKQENTRKYSIRIRIKYDIATGIADIREFENITRVLDTKFAYAVSYGFCKKVRNEVNEYNHAVDNDYKGLDENGTKREKISLDFSRLMQSVRGAIKWSVPPKSLQEAAARVLAADQYDYSADREENKQIIPTPIRSCIGNLRSYHMEYVLPRHTT